MSVIYRYLKKRIGNTFYDGWFLLPIVQGKAMRAVLLPKGDGTPASPYRPTCLNHWRSCSILVKSLKNNEAMHLQVWGRLLRIDHRCYVSDIGPAWRRGALPVQINPVPPTANPNHYANRVAEAARLRQLLSTNAVTNLNVWKQRNTDDDPSYRSAAQRIVDPRRVYVEAPDGDSTMTWKEVASSPMIARVIRAALHGRTLQDAKALAGFRTQDYSRLQKLIPVMTAAWFVSEPARNARVFVLNLMLLDLAEAGRDFPNFASLTWDRLFWGPEILKHPKNHVMSRVQIIDARSAPFSDTDRRMVPVTSIRHLWTLGGVMSASPFGGANKVVKKEIPTGYEASTPLIKKAIQHGKPQNKLAHDYIHEKEISIVTQWLQLKSPAEYQATDSTPGGWEWSDLPQDDSVRISAMVEQLFI